MFNPKEEVPQARERYYKETKRLYGVIDRHLADNEYFAGGEYTIADIAVFPWVHRNNRHQVDLDEFPNVERWYDELWKRPAVDKGMSVPFLNE